MRLPHTLQSPPEGTSYCSRKVARVSVNVMPENDTFLAPSIRTSAESTGATISVPTLPSVEFGQ